MSTDAPSGPPVAQLPIGRPMGWMDGNAWRLPSGKALSEFALRAGFLAPLLLKADSARAVGSTPMVAPEIRGTL